jgi:NitT/TauT family transport system substrate-binding protein
MTVPTMSRRALLTTASAGLLGLTLPACGSEGGSGSGGTVRFGYIGDFNGASLLAVAERQGLWSRHELSPDVSVFTNGPIQIQALEAGSLDFGYIGPGALWLPASGRSQIVAINTLTFADRVIARPSLSRVADLEGQRVGVAEGTSGEMILRLALAGAGMSIDDVETVPMDPATIVSAFSSGEIEAAGIWYPLIDTIRENVPDVAELAATDDFPDYSFPTAFVAGRDIDRTMHERVVRVLQEANAWRQEHPGEAIAETARMLDLDPATVEADASHVRTMPTEDLVSSTEDGTVADWLSALNDLFVDTGQLPSAPDPASYYAGDVYSRAFSS